MTSFLHLFEAQYKVVVERDRGHGANQGCLTTFDAPSDAAAVDTMRRNAEMGRNSNLGRSFFVSGGGSWEKLAELVRNDGSEKKIPWRVQPKSLRRCFASR